MSALAARLGRAAALALALAVAGAVVAFGALPLLRHAQALDHDIALSAGLAERLSAKIRDRDRHAGRVQALAAELAASDRYVRADTDALAAAEVQRRFLDAAAGSGLTVLSVQSLPSVEDAGAVRVTVRAETAGPVEALSALVYRLEAARPYLFLDNLAVRAAAPAAPGSDAAMPLHARFDIAGYLAPEPTP